MLDNLVKSQLLRADLVAADEHFVAHGYNDMTGIVLLKSALVAVSNLVDFEPSISRLYKEAPHLSAFYKTASKEFKFAKYLRNKFAGHIHPELLAKAIEWKPELRFLADRMDEQQIMWFCNLCVLETAINTYVDQSGEHLVFDSETDLFFPDDQTRFRLFLEKIIKTGVQYLTELGIVLRSKIDKPVEGVESLEYWKTAGLTEFNFIAKQ
ncbi:hypothetical protein SM66_02165 [Klebsiella quasipneumoniae subsp. quasipneumoniae]|uniref:hypothetical protein n=1 Tax=Klebsiella quasipneumoniae TaxID=1463165 RepID=UPI0006501728|nr:hypothetical protein [Klebsiella quasipneumoniae]KMH15914.1 hypothetical protein SM66_02165 [Klebsiella quasipneumoniae subsp. quasipneumoniae]VGD93675.1 Uncharacterised protein [Klebsiella quasipneumoniae]HBQ6652373.1 hypothetical protein [Klebsiella quasipneumoniae subsp. quasipneumoniae]